MRQPETDARLRRAEDLEREAARLRNEDVAATPVKPAPEPVEIQLLREIRDELKAGRTPTT